MDPGESTGDGEGSATELQRAVERATRDTPYAVVGTEKGFDVELRVDDVRWRQFFGSAGLRLTFRWEVREKKSRYSVNDVAMTLRWAAGVPRLDFSASKQSGRLFSFSRTMIWAPTVDGGIVPVADYRFDSSEGRDLVRIAARQLGMKEQLPFSLRAANVAIIAPFVITLGFFIVEWLLQR
jgi:hypothetical protein